MYIYIYMKDTQTKNLPQYEFTTTNQLSKITTHAHTHIPLRNCFKASRSLRVTSCGAFDIQVHTLDKKL